MSGRIVSDACIAIPLLGTQFTDAQIAAAADWRSLMQDALRRFAKTIVGFRTAVGSAVGASL